MFQWLSNLWQTAGVLGNLPRIQEEMAKFQASISQVTAEGDAGAGMVKAKVNGRSEVLSVKISDDAMKLNDREMLEDLVRGAVNKALEKVKEAVAAETAKMGAALNLPPGFKLPGM